MFPTLHKFLPQSYITHRKDVHVRWEDGHVEVGGCACEVGG